MTSNYPHNLNGIEWVRQYEEWKMTNKLLTKGALASKSVKSFKLQKAKPMKVATKKKKNGQKI